jgi:glycosyltransferase involved in cell wall biosynthesis
MRRVPAVELDDLRASLGIPRSASTVVMVARLRPEKGHAVLLDALPAVVGQLGRPLHAVLVGDGPLTAAIVSKARSLPGVPVHMVGHQDDVAPWYALADVVAIPSLNDAFPLVAVEAMASGKPVVASAVGGLREAIQHEHTGLLVEPDDPDSLGRSIVDLLANPSLAGTLAAAGNCDYQARFTTERMAAAWLAAYETAVKITKRRQ